ncbi:hypothetical protein KKC60_04440 [Patescibacteria group bacterium]|nr:hypothetical protein [Patescibacteria group bacterium]
MKDSQSGVDIAAEIKKILMENSGELPIFLTKLRIYLALRRKLEEDPGRFLRNVSKGELNESFDDFDLRFGRSRGDEDETMLSRPRWSLKSLELLIQGLERING